MRARMRSAHGRGKAQRGFALVVAIFLVTTLGVLVVALNTVVGAQARNQVNDVLGLQASLAARTGLEYGAYRATRLLWDCTTPDQATFQLPGSLNRFWVTVDCYSTTVQENGGTSTVWEITASACNQRAAGICPGTGAPGYVERRMRTSLTSCPSC